MTLTAKVTGMQEHKNFCVYYIAKFWVYVDEILYAVGICWSYKTKTHRILSYWHLKEWTLLSPYGEKTDKQKLSWVLTLMNQFLSNFAWWYFPLNPAVQY